MSIEQLREYCDLGAQGVHTEPARRRILTEHRSQVEAQIEEAYAALRLIDHKLSFYSDQPNTGYSRPSTSDQENKIT